METHETAAQQPASETFQFKYVAEEELLRIVRKVRREKRKEKDALRWKQFTEEKGRSIAYNQNVDLEDPPLQSVSCPQCPQGSNADEGNEGNESILKISERSECGQDSLLSVEEGPHLPLKRPVPIDGGITARETGVLQRIGLLRHRISLALDSIASMIQCRPAEPDGPDDLERRKTRINEFLSRFSRNYLFQFQRQVAELRKHIAFASPETPGRHTEHQALMQKLVSAHQTAVQGLQVYLTQIPTSLQVSKIFGKLGEFLHHLCELSSLKNQLSMHAGILNGCEEQDDPDEIYLKCKELFSLLEEKRTETEDISMSACASLPVSARGSLNPRNQRLLPRSHGSLPPASWKKTSAYLARAKFGAPSSVRSSITPHASSRDHHSHEERYLKNDGKDSCCNSDLREIITHMHEVLCNKVVAKNKKKIRCRSKHVGGRNVKIGDKSLDIQKPLTEVQNLSNNVQLVITQHCDSDVEGHRDVATDTCDLHDKKLQHNEDENRKSKKVVWAAEETLVGNNVDPPFLEQSTTFHTIPKGTTENADIVRRMKRAPEQRVLNYKQRFQEYNNKVQNPTVKRWCEDVLDCVFQEISEELEPSFLLEKMYHLEFKDP